ADDVWPEATQIGKGEHTLQLQLRHTDVAKLEKLKTMPMLLERPLAGTVSLGVFGTPNTGGGGRFGSRSLEPGQRATVFIAPPSSGQIPKSAKPGDFLVGTVTYGQSDAAA